MILEAIAFTLGCWIAGAVLGACKLQKITLYFSFGGIPFHELSHLVACIALGVRVRSITLLHVSEAGARGNVEPREPVRDPFTALVIALAPAAGAVLWTCLFAWGVVEAGARGFDPAWTWLLLYLAVATGTRAAPSGGDWHYAGHAISQHPGQFLAGLGGSILAGAICYLAGFPLVEWWHLALLAVAVLGPGVALSKLYGWRRGV
ncbi:MAG: hypothetical protein GYA24_10910 [Candidatus Lokiarchaeota archaeon]|nr:hypothetical protein [Candidatus Lokiarchaeota archaeon]